VSKVALIRPPITTVASRRCTSAPELAEIAMGRKPRLATVAVMSTGCSRVIAAWHAAAAAPRPVARAVADYFCEPFSVAKYTPKLNRTACIRYRMSDAGERT
jgi:hypothetical protein